MINRWSRIRKGRLFHLKKLKKSTSINANKDGLFEGSFFLGGGGGGQFDPTPFIFQEELN